HAHATAGITFERAERAQDGLRDLQRPVTPVKRKLVAVRPPVHNSAGTGRQQTGVDRQAQDGPCVQLELTLALRNHGDHAGVVRPGADFAEPDLIVFDEQFNAKDALAAQVVGDGFGDVSGFFKRLGLHRLGLPAFYVVALRLQVSDGFAEMRFNLAVGTACTHGQYCDFIIVVNEAFHNNAPMANPAAFHRNYLGALDIYRAV